MDTNLKVDFCTRKAALYAVERYHYSKCLPVADMVTIGVWENDKFSGCVIYARGSNPQLSKPYKLKSNEVVELTRVALSKHKSTVTKIISLSLNLLKNINPGLKLIVSFADTRQGHIGKIYQAGNWIYTGLTKGTPEYFYKGKWIHQRQKGCLKLKKEIIDKLKKRSGSTKLRYIMPLNKKIRRKVIKMSVPYIKELPQLLLK